MGGTIAGPAPHRPASQSPQDRANLPRQTHPPDKSQRTLHLPNQDRKTDKWTGCSAPSGLARGLTHDLAPVPASNGHHSCLPPSSVVLTAGCCFVDTDEIKAGTHTQSRRTVFSPGMSNVVGQASFPIFVGVESKLDLNSAVSRKKKALKGRVEEGTHRGFQCSKRRKLAQAGEKRMWRACWRASCVCVCARDPSSADGGGGFTPLFLARSGGS